MGDFSGTFSFGVKKLPRYLIKCFYGKLVMYFHICGFFFSFFFFLKISLRLLSLRNY